MTERDGSPPEGCVHAGLRSMNMIAKYAFGFPIPCWTLILPTSKLAGGAATS